MASSTRPPSHFILKGYGRSSQVELGNSRLYREPRACAGWQRATLVGGSGHNAAPAWSCKVPPPPPPPLPSSLEPIALLRPRIDHTPSLLPSPPFTRRFLSRLTGGAGGTLWPVPETPRQEIVFLGELDEEPIRRLLDACLLKEGETIETISDQFPAWPSLPAVETKRQAEPPTNSSLPDSTRAITPTLASLIRSTRRPIS